MSCKVLTKEEFMQKVKEHQEKKKKLEEKMAKEADSFRRERNLKIILRKVDIREVIK